MRLLFLALFTISCCSAQSLQAGSDTVPWDGESYVYADGYSEVDVDFASGGVSAFAITWYTDEYGMGYDQIQTEADIDLYIGYNKVDSAADYNNNGGYASAEVYGQVQNFGEVDFVTSTHIASGYYSYCDESIVEGPCGAGDVETTLPQVEVPLPPYLSVENIDARVPNSVDINVVLDSPALTASMSCCPAYPLVYANNPQGTLFQFTINQTNVVVNPGTWPFTFYTYLFGLRQGYGGPNGGFILSVVPLDGAAQTIKSIQVGVENNPPYGGTGKIDNLTYNVETPTWQIIYNFFAAPCRWV